VSSCARWQSTILILGVAWIGYTVWPLYDLRAYLTNQIVAAYVSGIQISPLAQSMAASALGITDPVVAKLFSPEALSELLSVKLS
jgi:hypothetical protein